MIEQGSPEWHQMRCGRVTASRISDVMSKGRGSAPSVTRSNYLAELVAERLTGVQSEGFTNAAMAHGTDTEPRARAAYEWHTGQDVEQVAFISHPTIELSGSSPDGLVGLDGGVEIKCPNTATHLSYIFGGTIPKKYRLQMQWGMACTGRKWWDFVSFDPRLPDDAGQYHVERFEADADLIAEIEAGVKAFLAEVAETAQRLRAKFGSDETAQKTNLEKEAA